MINSEILRAHREDPERILQLLEEGLGEDFRILTDFNAERSKIEWLSRTRVVEGHRWRVAKNYSEASRFARTKISCRYESNLRNRLEDEMSLIKPDYYKTAIFIQ